VTSREPRISPAPRLPAQAGRQVQRAAAVPIADANRLTSVEPDPDRERELGHVERFLDEPPLEGDRCTNPVARRGEHAQGFVPPQLEEYPPLRLDDLARDLGEPRCELPGSLVAALLREERVSADIGYQERADSRVARARSTAIGHVQAGHPAHHPRGAESGQGES
jgi:hypothetical protein